MIELFWPGDARAGGVCSETALVAAMVRVESAWLNTLADAGLAPGSEPLPEIKPDEIADDVEADGNPVIPLVAVLRSRLGEPARTWLHRGLTSQDVLDTALVLCLRDAADGVLRDVYRQVVALRDLAASNRHSVRAAR